MHSPLIIHSAASSQSLHEYCQQALLLDGPATSADQSPRHAEGRAAQDGDSSTWFGLFGRQGDNTNGQQHNTQRAASASTSRPAAQGSGGGKGAKATGFASIVDAVPQLQQHQHSDAMLPSMPEKLLSRLTSCAPSFSLYCMLF
jgi:hypothetical protein